MLNGTLMVWGHQGWLGQNSTQIRHLRFSNTSFVDIPDLIAA